MPHALAFAGRAIRIGLDHPAHHTGLAAPVFDRHAEGDSARLQNRSLWSRFFFGSCVSERALPKHALSKHALNKHARTKNALSKHAFQTRDQRERSYRSS